MRSPGSGPALAAIALAAALALPASAAAEKQGPLVISSLKLDQNKLVGKIDLRVRGERLPLGELQKHPEALWVDGRHLCLAVDGAGLRRRLFCFGGPVKKGRTRVGVSRYFANGRATRREGFGAEIDRPAPNRIKLRFPLAKAGFERGRLRYFALSSWRGASCRAADDEGSTPELLRIGGPEGPCQDRAPKSGRKKARIVKVETVGCTSGNIGLFNSGSRSRKRVALTFDDGPSSYTSQILDHLDRRDAKATFFHVGSQMGGSEGLLKRIVAHGHELGNHSWAHESYPSSSSMRSTNRRIRAATGFSPCTFRPPYGSFNRGTVDAARSNGMSVALWDIDTSDYTQPGSSAIYSRAVRAGRGSIVLMHDGGGSRRQTVDAVPRIIKKLQSRGYELVTVTELMGGHFKLREKR